MSESPREESVKAELQGSVDFVIGMLVFGASVFSVLINLCFLAVENDLNLKRAYLVVAHADEMQATKVTWALEEIDRLLTEDARDGGRPILCEEDADLIALYDKLEGAQKAKLGELLARKTGTTNHWKELYLEALPSSRSPYRMPSLELSLMYYGWVIEVGTIIFLSQSLRKKHVQDYLYTTIRKPQVFLPTVTLLLFVPAWHWAILLYPRSSDFWIVLTAGTLCAAMAGLLYKVGKLIITPARMNEVGFHLLISSLFIQLLTAMGDPDVVYTVFSAPRMYPLRYLSWFIILCYPGLMLEKWYKATRSVSVPSIGVEEPENAGP